MISSALEKYGLDSESLVVHQKLPENSHGDLHFKIQLQSNYYSVRFIGSDRYPHDAFGKLTDDILLEQMKFCDFSHANEIPLMSRIPPADGHLFIHSTWNGILYRF